MLRVAFLGALSSSFADRVRVHLTVPCDFIHTDEKNAVDVLPEVDILVTLVFTREMGASARQLKLIQVPGAGLDRIDRSAMKQTVLLAKVHGHEAGIAEYVIGAIIALSRNFERVTSHLREGRWESQWAPGVPPPPVWQELAGRTLGIFRSTGASARRSPIAPAPLICRLPRSAATWGAPRRTTSRFSDQSEILDELLRISDYLAITMPLTLETQGLLGVKQLALLKPTAILVNVSRAQIVDEGALYDALAERRIAGAALDVWYRYPSGPGPIFPAERPFHTLPNVLMTPHVSGWTDGMLEARAKVIAENVARTARGEPPVNRVV